MPRRFGPPWSIEEGAACFIVRDHDRRWLDVTVLACGLVANQIQPSILAELDLGYDMRASHA